MNKYQKHIQYPVIDLNMELLVKFVIKFNLQTIFEKKIYFRCVTGTEFPSDYNKSNAF